MASSITISQAHPERRIDAAPLKRVLRRVLEAEGHARYTLSVVLADHATVLELNRTYLAHDYLTDVLSFDLRENEDEAPEGELYIDLDTATERYAEFGTSFTGEVHRYAVHGLLHLLGYRDATPEERGRMRALEDRYLAAG